MEKFICDRNDSENQRVHTVAAAHCLTRLANENVSALHSISWDCIEILPCWCLLENDKRIHLQLLVGTLYMLPTLQSTIDGKYLGLVRDAVGEHAFDEIMRIDTQGIRFVSPDLSRVDNSNIEKQLMSAGASVLLSTLQDKNLVRLFLNVTGIPAGALQNKLAMKLYLLACDVFKNELNFD